MEPRTQGTGKAADARSEWLDQGQQGAGTLSCTTGGDSLQSVPRERGARPPHVTDMRTGARRVAHLRLAPAGVQLPPRRPVIHGIVVREQEVQELHAVRMVQRMAGLCAGRLSCSQEDASTVVTGTRTAIARGN